MTPAPPHVSVVLPLLGDAAALVEAVEALAATWPADVDAELLVPAPPLDPRSARLLGALEGDVALVPCPQGAPLGELVLAAAGVAAAPRLLVLDQARLPGDLPAAARGTTGPEAVALPATGLPPVLSAATDLRALAALARGPLHPSPGATGAPLAGPGEPGLVSLLVPSGDVRTARQSTRVRTEVVRDLADARGAVVVALDPQVELPRFWAEGLLAALEAAPDAVAAGPHWDGQPLPRGTTARTAADAWRRAHAGALQDTGALAPGCVAVRRSAAHLLPDPGALAAAGRLVTSVAVLARPGAQPLLSAALIVKDEQAALPACLDSLRGVVDEVVVCDTGSTDRTVEIAVALGARVVTRAWDDDFAAARNAALSASTGRWVLSIDADEQLRLEDGTDLRALLASSRGTAHSVRIHSSGGDGTLAGYAHEAGRLFRRGAVGWVGAVHENLHDLRRDAPPAWSPAPGVSLLHDGYLDDVYAAKDKTARNLALAEKDHAEAAGTSRAWKSAYELARALSKAPDGQDERIVGLLRECLEQLPPRLPHFRTDALVRMAGALARQGDAQGALAAAREALVASPADPAAADCCAGLALAVEGPEAALAVLDARPAPDVRSPAHDADKEEVVLPSLRARVLLRLGRRAEAVDVLLPVAAAHPRLADWPLLAQACGTDVARLADAVAADPVPALHGLAAAGPLPDGLEPALRARGVDVDGARPEGVRARELARAVTGASPEAVAEVVRVLEREDPGLAEELRRVLAAAVPAG